MDKQALKNILYGSIVELTSDRKYFHKSNIDAKYSYWTDDGEKVVMEILRDWTVKMIEEEKRSLDKQAKELVLKGLKGEDI